jgi:primosomal protein N' (replication factor Y)
MTFHRGRGRLVCHYCGTNAALPANCPSCGLPRLERLGAGTERLEAVVKERFPDARLARLDRDTAGSPRVGDERGLDGVLRRMQAGELDVLVGTQMVTKGHDFAGVTLVGVLLPDQGMHLPDFRAAERTFQLLEQVAGRAGRGDRPGRVIIQTYAPDHPAIEAVARHDYDGFARAELASRAEADYPPFSRMIALRVDAPDPAVARAAAETAAAAARAAGGPVTVRGPAEAPLARLRGRARWQVWLSSHDRAALVSAARAAARAARPGGDLRVAIDVDPQSVL